MNKFQIIRTDPLQFRGQILEFWDKYLPGTPPARFEWLTQGNPAGPAIWLFAFEDDKNELAGMVSILPKHMIRNGRIIHAGILGDFMVHSKYRVFGPNLLLLKTALAGMADLDFALLYTVPNAQSVQLIKRAGANSVGSFKNFVKPLEVKHYLSRHMDQFSQSLLAPFVGIGLRLISKDTYISSKGFFEEIFRIDASFDLLWNSVKDRLTLAGDHSAAYLGWKYLLNPHNDFRMLTFKESAGESLLGFLVFTVDQNRLNIYDMAALNKASINKLLMQIVRIGRMENCFSVNVEIFETNPLLTSFRSFGFLDAKTDFVVFSSGEEQWPDSGCYLFSGDRNI
jgi:hypothetical protein